MTNLRLPSSRATLRHSAGLGLGLLLLACVSRAQLPATETQTSTEPGTIPIEQPAENVPVELWTSTPENLPYFPPTDPSALSRSSFRPGPGLLSPGIRPRVFYRYQYATGIPAGPGERYSSHIHEFTPGIQWRIGDHLRLDYSPTFMWYSEGRLRDSVDHSVLLGWDTQYQAWRFDAAHRYFRTNSVLIETGGQAKRDEFQTTLGAALELNSQWAWESRFGHEARRTRNFQDFREFSVEQGLRYNVSERLGLGFGAGYGYVQVEDGSNHEYIRPRLTASYRAGEKLAFRGWAGAENRWYKDGLETTSPVYQLAADYQATEATQFSVSFNRSIRPSYFEDAVTRRRSIDVTLNQRFLGRYFLTLRGGRHVSSYSSVNPSPLDGRKDRSTYYSARLSTPIRDRGYVAVFYEPESENDSNLSPYAYSIRSYGAELGWQF